MKGLLDLLRETVSAWFESYEIYAYAPNASIFQTGGPFEIFSYDDESQQLIVKLSNRLIGSFKDDELVDVMERLDWHDNTTVSTIDAPKQSTLSKRDCPPELNRSYPLATWKETFPNAVSLLI
jgi:hypothetical protein